MSVRLSVHNKQVCLEHSDLQSVLLALSQTEPKLPLDFEGFGAQIGTQAILGFLFGYKGKDLIWTQSSQFSCLPVVKMDRDSKHGEEDCQLKENRVHEDAGCLIVQNSNQTLK